MMPLTFTPDESEDRRRKLYGDLAASGDKAMGYGFDALTRMETMAKEKKATDRQSGLDADARAKAAADLTLRQAQESRAVGADKRDSERDAFDLEQARGKATRDAEDRTMTLKRSEEDRARVQGDAAKKSARAQISSIVRAARVDGLDDQAMIERASATPGLEDAGINWQEIVDERRRQDEADRADKLARQKTESEIAENEAQATKAARASAGVDPAVADARKRKILADANAAEARAKASGTPDGMTKTTRSGVEKSLVEIGKVKAEAGALRKALSDPRVSSYTGPLSGLQNHLTSKVGLQEAEAARISSLIGQFFDAYKVAVTGAAATDAEMATLMTRMPNVDDNIPNMLAKLDAGDTLADARAQFFGGILRSGSVAPGGVSPTAANGGDKIRVKRKSDGKMGEMPASNFNPDLYERVQ